LTGEWYDERRGELLRRDEISGSLLRERLQGATATYHVASQRRYVIVRQIRDGLTQRLFVVDDYPYEADDEESKEEAEFRRVDAVADSSEASKHCLATSE